MRDFSYAKYRLLIINLQKQGYTFQSFQDFIQKPSHKAVVLRHDIDIFAFSALPLAKLELDLGVTGSYYFRTTKYSYRPKIISHIAALNHEIGYHYEDLTRNNGDVKKAIREFEQHLAMFRSIYPVTTVCMHGRSGSPYDNRDLWKQMNLVDYGLIGEPYLSIDFNRVLYMSDTTQKWDGNKIAVRDKVKSSLNLSFRTTDDILMSIDKLPNHIMITIHPELWAGNIASWMLAKLFVFTHGNYKKLYRNKRMKNCQGNMKVI